MLTINLAKTEKVFPRNHNLDSWITPRTINMLPLGSMAKILNKLTCVHGFEAQYGLNCCPPLRFCCRMPPVVPKNRNCIIVQKLYYI